MVHNPLAKHCGRAKCKGSDNREQRGFMGYHNAPNIDAIDSSDLSRMYPSKEAMRDAENTYIEEHGYAESFTDLAGVGGTGKLANDIGIMNEILTENFEGVSYSDSYTGESINAYLQDEYEGKKITKEVRIMAGLGIDGGPVENLIIRDEDGIVLETRMVTRGAQSGRPEYEAAAHTLMRSSSGNHRAIGQQMIMDIEFKSKIQQSDIYGGSKGSFLGLNATDHDTGEEIPIKWSREKDYNNRPVWKVHIGEDTSPQLFGEDEIVRYLFNYSLKKNDGESE